MTESMIKKKREIFEQTLTDGYDHDRYVRFLRELLDNMQLAAPDREVKPYNTFSAAVEYYRHIGSYADKDNNKVALFSVCLVNNNQLENARSMQRAFVKSLLESSNCAGALVAFHTQKDPDKWRLSLVRLDYEFSKGKLSEKLTPAKRYSYLVGKDEPCHTAKERLYPIFVEDELDPGLDELEASFSVEAVTKDFFDRYRDKYLDLKEYLDGNPNFVAEAESRGFDSEQFAKKLMGQIVFLYFIQKKGWLGVNAFPAKLTESEYKNGFYRSGQKPKQLMPYVYKKGPDGAYHRDSDALLSLTPEDETILSTLVSGDAWGKGPRNFMRSLFEGCKKRGKNFFDDYLEPLFYNGLNQNRGENAFFPPLHRRIPFLNGGLFEEMEGYDWHNNHFSIPNELFSDADKKSAREADGILDVFDRYNFTMAEDEPMEREVAIDPEMLGKVFENLLEVSDRKSKGAFYTPREIVHYMCQESLINYLSSKTGIDDGDIRKFILYGEYFRDEDVKKTLYVKDENTGKGNMEFDYGKNMEIPESILSFKKNINRLQEIDDLLANVRVVDPAVGSGAFPLGILTEIVKARETVTTYTAIGMNGFQRLSYRSMRTPYRMKRDAIKNSIFGCDIEPSATDIAKLRLWLSLVIDDQIMDREREEFDQKTKPRELPNLDCNIICGNSLMDEFEGMPLITASSVLRNDRGYQGSYYDLQVGALIQELIELQSKLYDEKDHVAKESLKNQIQDIYNEIVTEQLKVAPCVLDDYYKAIRQPSKPFVLWQLYFPKVFRDNGGFDIVIGNPPYIKERDNHEVFDEVNNSLFGKKYHQGKMDYWYYFLHKAIDISSSNSSISFITPRYWLNSAGATGLIKRIKTELSFVNVVDIGKLKVFDNVVGLHMIALYSKKKRESFVYKKLSDNLSGINCTYSADNVEVVHLSNANAISDENEIVLEIRNNYENCVLLGDISDISQGVVEASDCVSKRMYDKNPKPNVYIGKGIFVLSIEEVNALNLNDKEKALLVPYADGDNFSRYKILKPKRFLIYSDQTVKDLIEKDSDYCHIKKHLDEMTEFITSSNKPYGLHRPRKRYYFEETKIIMPSMFAENNFVLDNDAHLYVGMSFSCIIVNDSDYLPEYILAILNSKVAYDWFYSFGKKRGAGVDIGVQKIRTFPIKKCDMCVQKSIADSVKLLMLDYEANEELDNIIDKKISELYEV